MTLILGLDICQEIETDQNAVYIVDIDPTKSLFMQVLTFPSHGGKYSGYNS